MAIDKNTMKYRWSEIDWVRINKKNEQYHLATIAQDSFIVGFSLYSYSFEQSHLLKIAVHKDCQRKNIATELFFRDCLRLKELNVSNIYLEVEESNEAALSFYIKHGFRMLTVKKNFYSDGLNANAMSLQLK